MRSIYSIVARLKDILGLGLFEEAQERDGGGLRGASSRKGGCFNVVERWRWACCPPVGTGNMADRRSD